MNKLLLAILTLWSSTLMAEGEGGYEPQGGYEPPKTIPAKEASKKQEKLSSIEQFRGETQGRLLLCQITEYKATLDGSGSELTTCLKDGREAVKKAFAPANKSLAKKPVLAKLLKEYYVAWLSAFDAVQPGPGEIKLNYDRRSKDAEAKSEDAWNRFEIESEL